MEAKDRFEVNTLTWALNDYLLQRLYIKCKNNNLKQNNMNELKITIPEGFEIDKENSTFELIKFKKIEKQLPKRWLDLECIKGYWIDKDCLIREVDFFGVQSDLKNVFPTKEYTEASLALAQLLQLRQVYNNGWEPDWSDKQTKHTITSFHGIISVDAIRDHSRVMSFKTAEIRDLFFENFKELLEIAKPLL